MTSPHLTAPTDAGIWSPRYVWVTVGAAALIFLAAMQSLAITTVMPIVSADLDGEALYAVAFAGTLATSVIGMVAALLTGLLLARADHALHALVAVVTRLLPPPHTPVVPTGALSRVVGGDVWSFYLSHGIYLYGYCVLVGLLFWEYVLLLRGRREVRPVALVEALANGRVDPGVHGVRLEIQGERGGGRLVVCASARGEYRGDQDEGGKDPAHGVEP